MVAAGSQTNPYRSFDRLGTHCWGASSAADCAAANVCCCCAQVSSLCLVTKQLERVHASFAALHLKPPPTIPSCAHTDWRWLEVQCSTSAHSISCVPAFQAIEVASAMHHQLPCAPGNYQSNANVGCSLFRDYLQKETKETLLSVDGYCALLRVFKIGGVGAAGPLCWPSPTHLKWQNARRSRPTTGRGDELSTLVAPPFLPFRLSMVVRCQRRPTTHSSSLVTITVLVQKWLFWRAFLHA